MSEEKHNLQRQADRAKPGGSKRSVLSYLVILFFAAFILLLFAYLMEQRSNEEAINGLTTSISSMQNAQQVYEENSQLKEQLNQLEDQLQALQNELSDLERENTLLQGENESLASSSELTAQAMDWFWQINEAYVRGRNSLARELIESLNYADLTEYLPRESITNNGRFSPYARYQEIYDALY